MLDEKQTNDISVCTRLGKKTKNAKQIKMDFPNSKKEKDCFLVAKEALKAVDYEAKGKVGGSEKTRGRSIKTLS